MYVIVFAAQLATHKANAEKEIRTLGEEVATLTACKLQLEKQLSKAQENIQYITDQ